MIGSFHVRYVYRFPQDIWRCVLWVFSAGFLIWAIVLELFEMRYSRKRYEDYLIWETERTQSRLDLISRNKYKSSMRVRSGKDNIRKFDNDIENAEHVTINETTTAAATTADISSSLNLPTMRSHHSQHHPLPPTIPTGGKGKPNEPLPSQQAPVDAPTNTLDSSTDPTDVSKTKPKVNKKTTQSFPTDQSSEKKPSRFVRFLRRIQARVKRFIRSYYMYYSLNNLFDWVVYIFCLITIITHFIDVGYHTVARARSHMYVASITVILIWFRFMVFFRTISISFTTLKAKMVEIKLGELVIMVS